MLDSRCYVLSTDALFNSKLQIDRKLHNNVGYRIIGVPHNDFMGNGPNNYVHHNQTKCSATGVEQIFANDILCSGCIVSEPFIK